MVLWSYMFDLITVGDSTIDTFIQIHDASVEFDLNHHEQKLCLKYGSKIPVDGLTHLVAGNAANNAVGARRLGLKTAIYTNVGTESAGTEICRTLSDEKVDGRYIIENEGMESNFSAVLNFKGERTIFVYHQQWKYVLPDLDKSRWIYFTSIASSFVHSNIDQELINYIQRTGAKLFYNPGTYQIKAGVKKYPQILALTDTFIVNKAEAEIILDLTNKREAEKGMKMLLKKLHSLGPSKVIITDGKNGSCAFDGENFYHLNVFPAQLVEMTGAGDGYATGVLAAFFYGKDLKEAMRWGAANSASVIEDIGPQSGLLMLEQMQDRLNTNKKIKVELF